MTTNHAGFSRGFWVNSLLSQKRQFRLGEVREVRDIRFFQQFFGRFRIHPLTLDVLIMDISHLHGFLLVSAILYYR